MVTELVGEPGISCPTPAAIVSPVEDVAVSETVPVGSAQAAPEHFTVALNLIGAPCTTGVVCPIASFSVVVDPSVAEAACQLFTKALASKEPKPDAKS